LVNIKSVTLLLLVINENITAVQQTDVYTDVWVGRSKQLTLPLEADRPLAAQLSMKVLLWQMLSAHATTACTALLHPRDFYMYALL